MVIYWRSNEGNLVVIKILIRQRAGCPGNIPQFGGI
jgi:hypothetical protein